MLKHNLQAFSELGDAATLAGKDKLFVLDNEAHMATHGYVNHIVPHAECLPRRLQPGKTTTVAVRVSDVPPAVKGAVRLRLQLETASKVGVQLNGRTVDLEPAAELEERFGMAWLAGSVAQEVLKNGENRVAVRLADGAAGVRLTGVEVAVRYSGTE